MILNSRSWTKIYIKIMEKVTQYVSVVNQAYDIVKEKFNNAQSVEKAKADKNALVKELENDSCIKVPFVGDFNAGKSSLINSIIGREILPTNILPETAVSYELFYAADEKLEVWLDDKLVQTVSVDQINSLQLTPNNLVKLYLNNAVVKDWNDRNIVVVDMPGIDSGVEAHNNAILHYVQDGNYFVLVSEAEGGTLRSTTLNFVDEIKKYGASLAIVISKADKKPVEDVANIKAQIEDVAKRIVGPSTQVATASAVNHDFEGVLSILNSIDANALVESKYQGQVAGLIDSYIAELGLQMKLLLADKSDFSTRIEELKNAQALAIENIKKKADMAQSVEGSADDILQDIAVALKSKAAYIASLLYGQVDSNVLNQEILTIVRPVIVNSFKREISEYSDVIGGAIQEFTIQVDEIVNDKNNKALVGAEELVGNLLGKDILEKLLKKGLDKLAERLIAYKGLSTLLKSLSKILGPVVTIIINVIPDLLRLIFGKSKEQKIEELKVKFASEVVGRIVESLRTPIEDMIKEQRAEVDRNVAVLIESESQKYNDNIQAVMQQQEEEKAEKEKKVASLNGVIGQLNKLMQNI